MIRRKLARCKYLILWTLGFCIISGTAFTAETIRTRAWAHTEFGRIVFDWPTEVRFTAEITGKKLTIRFNKKFSTDFRPVVEKLQYYISAISIGDDGKSVVAKLKKSFQMRSFENEGAIVVDLAERPRGGSFGAAIAPPPIGKAAFQIRRP